MSANPVVPPFAGPPPAPGATRAQRLRLYGLRWIGRAYRQPAPSDRAPRSVLLIRPDHLGDMLFATPAFRLLRQALPQARLTLLAGPWSQAVIAGNPDLDEVLICPFPGFERKPTSSLSAPYRLLRQTAQTLSGRFDAAVTLRFDHWWGAWLAAAAGIPRRIGFDRPETRPFLTEPLPYRSERHEVEQNAALVAALTPAESCVDGPGSPSGHPVRRIYAGYSPSRQARDKPAQNATGEALRSDVSRPSRQEAVDGLAASVGDPAREGAGARPGPLRFAIGEKTRAWAAAWLAERGVAPDDRLIAIHPGAGAAVKQWPPAAWAEVGNRLAAQFGARILLTGGAGERSLTQAVATGLPMPTLDATGQTDLEQLGALLARCVLALGADSGPLHLAVAVGTPTVHLYGPVSTAKFGPWGAAGRNVVVRSPWPCAPCNRLDWPAAVLPQHACMAAIGVEDVVRAAEGVWRNA